MTNNTPYKSIVEVVAYHSKTIPNKVCLIEGLTGKECTYADFWRLVEIFSKKLQDIGVKSDDKVVVRTEQSINYLAYIMAIQLIGGVFVPIENNTPNLMIIEILNLVGTRFYVSSKPIEYDCGYLDINQDLDSIIEMKRPVDVDLYYPSPEKESNILFTTGTTGKSKGIVHTHYSLFSTCINTIEETDCLVNDVVLMPQPLNHSYGLRRTLSFLYVGATIVLESGVVYTQHIINSIEKYHVTVLSLVPTHLSILIQAVSEDLYMLRNQIRVVTIGTSATPITYQEKLMELLPNSKLILSYGATEVPGVCYYEYSKYSIRPFCIGNACKGSQVSIVDDDLNIIASSSQDEPGILSIEGPSVMKGYWKDEEQTNHTLVNGKVILADVGYLGEDGFWYILGRRDDIIISGGFKISPIEVEDIALQVVGIKECACVPIADSIMGYVPKLYVVMNDGSVFSKEVILSHFQKKLESYKIPRVIVEIDELPRTKGTNKILRSALK